MTMRAWSNFINVLFSAMLILHFQCCSQAKRRIISSTRSLFGSTATLSIPLWLEIPGIHCLYEKACQIPWYPVQINFQSPSCNCQIQRSSALWLATGANQTSSDKITRHHYIMLDILLYTLLPSGHFNPEIGLSLLFTSWRKRYWLLFGSTKYCWFNQT